jgi:hypothetical protein
MLILAADRRAEDCRLRPHRAAGVTRRWLVSLANFLVPVI